jgi:hypothetical protein
LLLALMIMQTRHCITPMLMALEGASTQAQPPLSWSSTSIMLAGDDWPSSRFSVNIVSLYTQYFPDFVHMSHCQQSGFTRCEDQASSL